MVSSIYNAMKNGELGTFYDHSGNHSLEETIKKLTSEEMLDQSEEIINYVRNYGFFEFIRTEKTSHDDIYFITKPLDMKSPYHEETRCKLSYLGGYKNCSCKAEEQNHSFIWRYLFNYDQGHRWVGYIASVGIIISLL